MLILSILARSVETTAVHLQLSQSPSKPSKRNLKRRTQTTTLPWLRIGTMADSWSCRVWFKTPNRDQCTSHSNTSLHPVTCRLCSTCSCSCRYSTWSALEKSMTKSTSSKVSRLILPSLLSGPSLLLSKFSALSTSEGSCQSTSMDLLAPSGCTACWSLWSHSQSTSCWSLSQMKCAQCSEMKTL